MIGLVTVDRFIRLAYKSLRIADSPHRCLLPLIALALLANGATPPDSLDPAFEKIPFNSWLSERDQTKLHWSVNVPRAELSFHQRLVTQVDIDLDGRDLESRRNDGRLVFFVQITDRSGTRYQNHNSLELAKLDENIKAADVQSSERAFFLPGEYQLAVALLDTRTGEHCVNRSHFRITASSRDVLPQAWHSLPAVEFIESEESPDSWYLPGIKTEVDWAAPQHSPAKLNVILNIAPSATRLIPSGGLPALLPTLKVLSETGSSGISEHVELLDLAHRKSVYNQDNVHSLDWASLKLSLGASSTSSIDVHSLSDRHHDAQFFVSQVRSLLRSPDTPSVLVILTIPVAFEPDEDLEPISLEALPACRAFYIRYRPPVERSIPEDPRMRRGGRGYGRMGSPIGHTLKPLITDKLEATLKPLNPRVLDVETPEQMAKAIIDIEKALASH